MTLKAIIWDLGGVLVRTEDRSRRLQWEKRLDLAPGELDRLVFQGEQGRAAAFGKAQAQDIWRALADQFGLSPKDRKTIEDDFWAGDRVDYDLIELTRSLRPRQKTGLLSNAWPDLRHALQNVWHIDDAFDEIVISAEVGLAKPDPAIYHLMLQRLALEPAQAIFIDDFIENIEAADQLGMETIHFTSVAETKDKLARLFDLSSLDKTQG